MLGIFFAGSGLGAFSPFTHPFIIAYHDWDRIWENLDLEEVV